MSDLALRLFFQGLIAFLPSDPSKGGASIMTAYVMNADDHVPTLTFEMNKQSVCPQTPDCADKFEQLGMCCAVERIENGASPWCTCYMGNGVEISFGQSPVGLHRVIGSPDPNKPVPTSANIADLAWTVSMSTVQGSPMHIDPNKVSAATRASISFSWLSERACQLDQEGGDGCDDLREKNCTYKAHSYKFEEGKATSNAHQAMAEYAMFNLRFPFSPSLTLKRADTKISLDLGCGAQGCPDVMISNPASDSATPCTDGEACHFVHYYSLVKENYVSFIPEREEDKFFTTGSRQLFACTDDPFRMRKDEYLRAFDQGGSEAPGNAAAAKRAKFASLSGQAAVGSRIVCPMALFDPSTQ
jgi:hypothetical protein